MYQFGITQMGTIGHAALYVGDGNIIHAIQKGVSESNLEKWQKDNIPKDRGFTRIYRFWN